MHAELVQDARDMVALGSERDVQAIRDGLAIEPLGQRLEQLLLTRRQPFDRLPVHPFPLAPAAREAQQVGKLVGGEQRLAGS